MKYYRTYEVFNVKSDSQVGNASWSIKNSFTGNFFRQVFRKLTYAKRSAQIDLLLKQVDAILRGEAKNSKKIQHIDTIPSLTKSLPQHNIPKALGYKPIDPT